FFTYFWTATQFNPLQIASDMKRGGAFIPGVRQGRPTQDYLSHAMSKITLIGGLSLALIAVFPSLVSGVLSVGPTITQFFGGTSMLILIGVILDTGQQIDSHVRSTDYQGMMLKPRKMKT
ncbi:MAG: SecY family transport protein, partial [Chlamydiota bacterium]|nr:SecY family transport protein [Chlamydiota bacterium]